MLRRGFLWALLLLVALGPFSGALGQASGEAVPRVKEISMNIGDNGVAYPQLEGLADPAVQQKINDDVVASGQMTAHILTLSGLQNSPWGLRVHYESYLDDQVFSTVLHAKGKQPGGRNGQSNIALTYDLRTGNRLTLAALFADVAGAVEAMEALAEETMAAELSEYMENAELSPLPADCFYLDQHSITFYYPAGQLSYLSGYAGACGFFYTELAPYLRADSEGLPARMGLLKPALAPGEAAAQIRQAVEAGALPMLPVRLGQPMADIVEQYRLVRTPDEFPGGRYFVLEAPVFRSVLLISDAMQAGWEHSVLEGIQAKRGDLYGLKIGQTNRAGWQAVLGQPAETIQMTDGMAFDYGLPKGQADVYRYGGHELRLYSDEAGTLACVQLGK